MVDEIGELLRGARGGLLEDVSCFLAVAFNFGRERRTAGRELVALGERRL